MTKNILYALPLCLTPLFFASCQKKNPASDIRQILDNLSSSVNISFIDKSYEKAEPIAQLINLPPHAEQSQTFLLNEDSELQIYAVGELLYGISDDDKKYYHKSDEIELFFQLEDNAPPRYFSLSFSDDDDVNRDTAEFTKEGVFYKGHNVKTLKENKYLVEIKVPWTSVGIDKVQVDTRLAFDVAIGDNDDGFFQHTKIVWSSSEDAMKLRTSTYGNLLLTAKPGARNDSPGVIQSIKATPVIDGKRESFWDRTPVYDIVNLVHGYVKDKYDLSAHIRSCWDESNLYFIFEIYDIKPRFDMQREKVKDRQLLVDYGWIEDEGGDKVWEMNADFTKHAGGATKNQKIDTAIHLKAGKYTLKYVSDESHSFGNWNDSPPEVPFIGVLIYKKSTQPL